MARPPVFDYPDAEGLKRRFTASVHSSIFDALVILSAQADEIIRLLDLIAQKAPPPYP